MTEPGPEGGVVGVRPFGRPESASRDRGRRALLARRIRRSVRNLVPLLQLTAAATAAWLIALQFGGHGEPFFAPIAVVVALSSPLGERGSNAVRLLAGVLVGIGAGELTTLVLGGGYGRLALATFAAMTLASALGGPRLVMVQAASAAILTVAAADGEAGIHRLIDAVIGAAVALVFSQVLLSPEPVALLRRAAAGALARMSEALTVLARALEDRDDARADDAMQLLRVQREALAELARLREASNRVVRHSAIWRSQIEPLVRENENVGHLDLLATSCLVLARSVVAEPLAEANANACASLGRDVQRLAGALSEMAEELGDRAIRQTAADVALAVALGLADAKSPAHTSFAAAVNALRMVAVDVMVVAGVDVDEAATAVRQNIGELRVPAPPGTPRLPFISERRTQPRS